MTPDPKTSPADQLEGPLGEKAAKAAPAVGRVGNVQEITTSTALSLEGIR